MEDHIYPAPPFVAQTAVIPRRTEFRGQEVLVEELYETAREKDIDIKLPYVLEEIIGNADNTEIDHVKIRNVETDAIEQLNVDGVFMFVGMIPNTDWLRGVVEMNEAGYIACDCTTLKTSMPGVFVARDCRQRAAMQLATACADRVLAAMGIKEYFQHPTSWPGPIAEQRIVEGR